MKLILATGNKGKLREFKEILEPLGYEILSQGELRLDLDVEETGETFEENAFIKANAVLNATGHAAVADDSGLCVEALGGAPGVHSARYGGGKAWTDKQKYEYLLEQMEGVADRRAKFVSCIVCLFPNGERIAVRGECPGRILTAPAGDAGFGYDPVFAPEGYDASFGQLGQEVKNTLSHRARALAALAERLKERGIC